MNVNSIYQKRIDQFINEVTIYPVSCEKLANGRSDEEWLDAVLAGGTKIVQLRDKESDDRTLYNKARIFRKKTSDAGALLIVNNRLDIAMMTDADGIHLGNSDIPAEEARKLAPNLIIGVSANTEEQAATAKERGASYYNIGPLFATNTKKEAKEFIGPDAISRYSFHSDLPFTVMGGIKHQHITDLTKLSARRIAVATALTQAEDIASETARWIKTIKENLSKRS